MPFALNCDKATTSTTTAELIKLNKKDHLTKILFKLSLKCSMK